MKDLIDNKEKRFLNKEYRAITDDDGNKYLEGYASVFNHRSKLIFEGGEFFYEYIREGAFDAVLQREDLDVVLTYQHNTGVPLSRLNKSKGIENLQLSVDDKGLKFRAKLSNTTDANNAYELVRSGDLFECSFIFTVAREEWSEDEEGNAIRYIDEVDNLFDVSVVVNGAYSSTDVAVAERSFNDQKEEPQEVEKINFDNDELILIKLKSGVR